MQQRHSPFDRGLCRGRTRGREVYFAQLGRLKQFAVRVKRVRLPYPRGTEEKPQRQHYRDWQQDSNPSHRITSAITPMLRVAPSEALQTPGRCPAAYFFRRAARSFLSYLARASSITG